MAVVGGQARSGVVLNSRMFWRGRRRGCYGGLSSPLAFRLKNSNRPINIIGARKTTKTTTATKGCRSAQSCWSAIKIQMQADGTPKPIQIAATVLRSRIACRFSILKNVHLRRDAIKVALSINLQRQRYANLGRPSETHKKNIGSLTI
jgi:hypothetical protein